MANKKIQNFFDMATLQVASEAFLKDVTSSSEFRSKLEQGNETLSMLPTAITNKFGFEDKKFILVAHQDLSFASPDQASDTTGLRSGFSASLFHDTEADQYTLSFRSTEFASDIRDAGDIEADLEVAKFGWAFSQIHSMESFWNFLTSGAPIGTGGISIPDVEKVNAFNADLAAGKRINVTGYSLGANLATAFTELHYDENIVDRTYLFNGAGTGDVQGALSFPAIWAAYNSVFSAHESGSPYLGIPPNTEATLAAQGLTLGQMSFQNAIALNPRHWRALDSIEPFVSGAVSSQINTVGEAQRKTDGFNSQIYDIWAQDHLDAGPLETLLLETAVASSGIRHGAATPIWYENQALASIDFLGSQWWSWGTGHSIVLLYDSLALMSVLEQIDPDVVAKDLGEIFSVASSQEYSSLEHAANALARLFGESELAPHQIANSDLDFADMAQRNPYHNMLAAIQGSSFFDSLTAQDPNTGEVPRRAAVQIADSSSAFLSARTDFGQFLALYYLSPFTIALLDSALEGELRALHGELGEAWQADRDMTAAERASGLGHFSDQYLADRTLFLTTLLDKNARDAEAGSQLTSVEHYSDAEHAIAFNAFPQTIGGAPRAQLAFGSRAGDVNSLPTSVFDDRVYGLGGDDTISGLQGLDYLEGGAGNDTLSGGAGQDHLVGGAGSDVLSGDEGDDLLVGGLGDDEFHWSTGDGTDTLLDADSGGDRIFVNGVDLSDLSYSQTSPSSQVYVSHAQPGLELSYNGTQLLIDTDASAAGGLIYVSQFALEGDSNFGINLDTNYVVQAPLTDHTVVEIGSGTGSTPDTAFYRNFQSQDWTQTGIRFDAEDVVNYTGPATTAFAGWLFEGGHVDDFLTGDGGANWLLGLTGADVLEGGAGSDYLAGGAGSDTITGGEGKDYIFGASYFGAEGHLNSDNAAFYLPLIHDEPGDANILDGGAGEDHISGGAYADQISGGSEIDLLFGNTGADTIEGGHGADTIYGDSGLGYRYEVDGDGDISVRLLISWSEGLDTQLDYSDTVFGGSGNDFIYGEQGNDWLYGDDGDDTLHGDRGLVSTDFQAYGETSPTLQAQYHGADYLFGGAGTDYLYGEAGDDFLAGGKGIDVLYGGLGNDTYLYQPGDGLGFVLDEAGSHTLLFSGVESDALRVFHHQDQVVVGTSFNAGLQIARSQWDNARIAIGNPESIVERSQLETHFLSEHTSNSVAIVEGSYGLTEAQRNSVLAVGGTTPTVPQFLLSSAAENVVATPVGHPSLQKARLSFSTEAFGPIFDFEVTLNQSLLDRITLQGGGAITFAGFSGTVNGTESNDRVLGSDGDDIVSTGLGDDVLIGGAGLDFLDGGHGFDTYVFAPGDGMDTVADSFGETRLEFDNVALNEVALYFTANSTSDFRIEYTATDSLRSAAGVEIDQITEFVVNGEVTSLTIRSDLEAGEFRGTAGNDVFETGSGDDIIYASGNGDDIYSFSAGDGSDTVLPQFETGLASTRAPRGEVRFEDSVNLQGLVFSYSNGGASVDYGTGDRVTMALDTVRATLDNALLYSSLASAADADWVPEIRAAINGTTYGSLGSDLILGSIGDDTIMPGYGDDVIEAGPGDDVIHLDKFYFEKSYAGIGHKDVRGGLGNDIVYTPLAQGLTYRFGLGDGHDTLSYNWSTTHDYELSGTGIAPYDLSLGGEDSLIFTPYGEDRLVFDASIALDEIRFQRIADDLRIAVHDGSDSIQIQNFFVTNPTNTGIELDEVATGGKVVASLEVLFGRGEISENPLRTIAVGGQNYDLPELISTTLEVLTLSPGQTLLGSEGADVINGGMGDNQIFSYENADTIVDSNGSNYIESGAGNDTITIGGESTVYAGSGHDVVNVGGGVNHVDLGVGDDTLNILGGTNTILFGKGGGNDKALINIASSTSVAFVGGLHLEDVSVDTVTTLELNLTAPEYPFEQVIRLTANTTGETLVLVGLDIQGGLQFLSGAAIDTLVVSDSLSLTGDQLWDMATAEPGSSILGTASDDVLIGTSGDDTIVGGAGDDVMRGLAGDDIFKIEGVFTQGVDSIDGGSGFDTIEGGVGVDIISLAELHISDSVERIDGLGGANFLTGSDADNVLDFSMTELVNITAIYSGLGDDTVYGSGGNDTIYAGDGNDLVHAGEGDDVVFGEAGDDVFTVASDEGVDEFQGGSGVDTIRLLSGQSSFTLSGMDGSNSIEVITADPGYNLISGTDDDNVFDFSSTTVENFLGIATGEGDDVIVSSDAAVELLVGGRGNDTITGGEGLDLYFYVYGDGKDVINQYNTDATMNDAVGLLYLSHQDVWFSQDAETDDLLIDIVGRDDQMRFTDWFLGDEHKVGKMTDHFGNTILTAGIDTLVQAMSVFDVPQGIGAEITPEVEQALDPVISSVWQSAA